MVRKATVDALLSLVRQRSPDGALNAFQSGEARQGAATCFFLKRLGCKWPFIALLVEARLGAAAEGFYVNDMPQALLARCAGVQR